MAIGEDVVEGLEARDGLILTEGCQQIGKFMLRDLELADGLRQGDEDWMFRCAFVAGIEFALPLVEKFEGCGGVADFVAEIVGDTAVGVDIEKMLAQALRKKPAGDREILVVRAGQAGAVFAGFGECGRRRRDGVGGGQAGPAEFGGGRRRGLDGGLSHSSTADLFRQRLFKKPERRENAFLRYRSTGVTGVLRLRNEFAFANSLLRSG